MRDHEVGAEVKVVLAEVRPFCDGNGDPAARAVRTACGDDVVGGIAYVRSNPRTVVAPIERVEGIGGAQKQVRVGLEERWPAAGLLGFQGVGHRRAGPKETGQPESGHRVGELEVRAPGGDAQQSMAA